MFLCVRVADLREEVKAKRLSLSPMSLCPSVIIFQPLFFFKTSKF